MNAKEAKKLRRAVREIKRQFDEAKIPLADQKYQQQTYLSTTIVLDKMSLKGMYKAMKK